MGAERGAANLARFNDERSAHLLPLLQHELQLCRKRKLDFKTPGLLAAYMADRLKVHRTTLLRNPKYKGLLLAHLAGQPGVVSRTPDTTSDPAILQAKLAAAKVSTSNLTAELKQAKAQLEQLHRGVPAKGGTNDAVAFSNLAMVLVNLLHRFPDYMHLDRERRELVDLSAKPSERLIAGKERMGQFVEWLELHQALPLVRALVLGDSGKKG
jgi:hypothetical protein